jgi:hypothetical protein
MAIFLKYAIIFTSSVPDSDPNPDPDPRVFWPPGSGSTSQRYGSGSINMKDLESYYFVTLFEFLSLKNNVNVPSTFKKQKKLC